ncbi:unnamed protein product [Discula destructiva]
MAGNEPSHDVPLEAARQNVDQLGINYAELPQRPFWAPLLGRTEEDFKVRIAAKVMAGSIVAGRELSQPEKDALALHYSRVLVTQAWDTPFVVASTLALYRGTYAKYGFPLWTPKPDKFNPKKIFGLPENPWTPRVWHSLRLIAWYTGCKFVLGIFTASYAISVYTANYSTDPRLADYRQTLQARRVRRAAPQQQQGWQQSRPDLPARDEPPSAWPSTDQDTDQSTQGAQSPWPAMQSSQPELAQDPFKADEPYVFDDASPVAPTEQQRGAPQQPAGSAWDRLRRQQSSNVAAGQGSSKQASAWGRKREDELTSRGARDGTSFSYTSGDEEKVHAKEQAQKDFDEMLERERRGEASGRR